MAEELNDYEEPLLTIEDASKELDTLTSRMTQNERILSKIKPNEYLFTKLKYFHRLEQNSIKLSPTSARLSLTPPPHVLPSEGTYKNIFVII